MKESFRRVPSMQIVNFYQSHSGDNVFAAHNPGVVTWWQVCNNRRLSSVSRSVAAAPDLAHLVAGDNPADNRMLPVIIRGNQSTCAVVQFQGRISQWIGHTKLAELRANGPQNHSLWLSPFNNEPANHHVIVGLYITASANVAKG